MSVLEEVLFEEYERVNRIKKALENEPFVVAERIDIEKAYS